MSISFRERERWLSNIDSNETEGVLVARKSVNQRNKKLFWLFHSCYVHHKYTHPHANRLIWSENNLIVLILLQAVAFLNA